MSELDKNLAMKMFMKCDSERALRDVYNTIIENAEVCQKAKAFKNELFAIRKDAQSKLRGIALGPYEDEAKRWKTGDVVYFGISDNRSVMDMSSFRMHRVYDIKAGTAVRVYQYQPRKKIAWLCIPGTPAKYGNVIDHPFTLYDLKRAEISRVEPAFRGDHFRPEKLF